MTITEKQINQPIAEILGWTEIVQASMDCWEGRTPPGSKNDWHEPIPNYYRYLDDCKEFEKTLNNSIDAQKYIIILLRITRNLIPRDEVFHLNGWTIYSMVTATSQQRCEAFLKLKGKEGKVSNLPD